MRPAPAAGLSGITRGALYMAGAALCFAVMTSLVRYCSASLPPLQIAFFRNFFAVMFMLPLFARFGLAALHTRHLGLHLTRAVTGVVAMAMWFTAIAVTPLTEAVALNFTLPLFAVIGAALFLKERVGPHRMAATAVGFLGMLVILRPGFQEVTPVMLLPVAAAVFMAVGVLIVKFVSADDKASTSVLYMNLLLTPLSLVPALFVWRTPDLWILTVLAALGFFAMMAHWLLARASAIADASAIIPFDYLRLPFIAVFAYFMFGQLADLWTWVGAAIIAASSIYIARRERRVARADQRTASEAGLHGRAEV